MKFLRYLLLLAAMLPALSLHAQNGLLSNNFTKVAAGGSISLTGTGISYHKLTWNVSGTLSACTVALDSSADGVTWSAGGVIVGQTCTSNGSSTVANVTANYVRMNVTAFTGTGSVNVTWTGYVNSPGGGGGGTVTSVSGTANEISVASGTTTPVLSIPATFIAPGSISSSTQQVTTSQVFDVTFYGAKCDSMTDDYAAITAAVTALGTTQGTLQFPAGVCLTSAAISIPQSMTIRGQSNQTTTIAPSGTGAGYDTFDVSASSVTFQTIQVDGGSFSSGSGSCIVYSTGKSYLTIDRTTVNSCYTDGVIMTNNGNVVVTNSSFYGSTTDQFLVTSTAGVGGSNYTFSNNYFDSTGATAPFVDLFFQLVGAGATFTNITITGNTILWPITPATGEQDGLVIDGLTTTPGSVTNVTISGNTIQSPAGTEGKGANDIELASVNNATITGNTLINGFNGVLIEGDAPANITVSGNTLTTQGSTGNSNDGILVNPGTGTAIQINVDGNTLTGWALFAVAAAKLTGGNQNDNVISVPNVSAAGGISCNVCESVNTNGNYILSANSGAFILNTAGATNKYLSYRGNIIKGTGYGYTLGGTGSGYTGVVIQGTEFDGISAANQYFADGGPFAGVNIVDDQTKCQAVGTAANPSVVACGNATSGIIYCDVAASAGTCTVNTTAVSTNSSIQITASGATVDGTLLSKTCNTTDTFGTGPLLAAKVAGTSFTINMPTVSTNGACFEWRITSL